MIPPVDEVDALFAPLVLLVLAVKHCVHGRKLAVEGGFPELLVLDGQNQHAGKVHQRPDVEHAHGGFAVLQKAQVADGKGGQGQRCGNQGRVDADLQMSGRPLAAALKIVHQAEQRTVHNDEKQYRGEVPCAAVGPEGAMHLPLDAGRKLGQNERPGAVVPRFQQGDAPGRP